MRRERDPLGWERTVILSSVPAWAVGSRAAAREPTPTMRVPAARPAAMPAAESSKTTHSAGAAQLGRRLGEPLRVRLARADGLRGDPGVRHPQSRGRAGGGDHAVQIGIGDFLGEDALVVGAVFRHRALRKQGGHGGVPLSAVGAPQYFVATQALRAGPPAPDPLHHDVGVHQRAVHVEQKCPQRAQGLCTGQKGTVLPGVTR